MPRVGDCKKGKIYAIRSHQTDQIYIGSTTQTLAQRLGAHRKNYRQYKEGKFNNISSFEILKHEDHYIELLEDYPCDNVNQLLRKEGEWIRKENCVNKLTAGQTDKEWRERNRDILLQKKKEYYERNKEHASQKKKEWVEKNREYVLQKKKEYYQQNKEKCDQKKREWYERNKEHVAQKKKEWGERNQEHVAQKRKEYYQQNKDYLLQKQKK